MLTEVGSGYLITTSSVCLNSFALNFKGSRSGRVFVVSDAIFSVISSDFSVTVFATAGTGSGLFFITTSGVDMGLLTDIFTLPSDAVSTFVSCFISGI